MTSSAAPPPPSVVGGTTTPPPSATSASLRGSWLVPVNSVSSSVTVTIANLPLASTSGGTWAATATLPPNDPVASSKRLVQAADIRGEQELPAAAGR